MDKVPFCDNPLCRFHGVQINPNADMIQRPLPVKEGEEQQFERHTRQLYHVQGDTFHVLCDVCSSAVELCRHHEKEKKVITPERKLVLLS